MAKSISTPPGRLELLKRRWDRRGDERTWLLCGLVLLTLACALAARYFVWELRGLPAEGEVVDVIHGSNSDTCDLQFTFRADDGRTYVLEDNESSNGYCHLEHGHSVPVLYLRSNPAIANPFPSSYAWLLVVIAGLVGAVLIIVSYRNERFFLRRLESSHEEPLKPGEVRIAAAVQPESVDPEPPATMSSTAIFYAILAAVVAIPLTVAFLTPEPLDAAQQRFVVPAPPEPPSGYALTLTEHVPETTGEQSHAELLQFEYERIQIIVIPPGHIAAEDRDRGITPSDSRDGAGQPRHEPGITYASRVGRTASDVRPYFMHGSVDITCGPIVGKDAAHVALMVMQGDLARASIDTAANGVRGPPRPVRKVYIEGTVSSFRGPDQFHNSLLKEKVMDLGQEEAEHFAGRVKEHQDKLERLEQAFDIPTGTLEAYAGQLVTVKGGQVLRHEDPGRVVLSADENGVSRPKEDLHRSEVSPPSADQTRFAGGEK